MQLKIIENEDIVKDPIRYLYKNFDLVEEGEKLYLKYKLDDVKELRIFFKDVLLTQHSRKNIKNIWDSGQGLEELIESLWIVKASTSGVLLFVPEKDEKNKKDGVFVLVLTKKYIYPSPIYFKRSHLNNLSVSLFYISSKSFIFILGKDDINAILGNPSGIIINKYLLQEK